MSHRGVFEVNFEIKLMFGFYVLEDSFFKNAFCMFSNFVFLSFLSKFTLNEGRRQVASHDSDGEGNSSRF